MKQDWVRPALVLMPALGFAAVVLAAQHQVCGCSLAGPDGAAVFWRRLLATVLPFGVLGGVVAFIRFGGRT